MAISPSRWLANEARVSWWREKEVLSIPNGLPLHQPKRTKSEVRKAYGIEGDARVLVTIAGDLSEARKGGDYLREAVKWFRGRSDMKWILIGANAPVDKEAMSNVLVAGVISDEERRMELLACADIFVHPAPCDNLPNVLVESLSVGVPIVGFAVGGVPEIVTSEVGWLAASVSTGALCACVQTALSELPAREVYMSGACRERAANEYSIDIQARRYEQCFASLAASR